MSSARIQLVPGAALTFNGIAQGFITDRVVSTLRAKGLEAELVSVGEIAAVGTSPVGNDWAVGLPVRRMMRRRQPSLRDKAVATSSPNGTLFGAGAEGHILTGRWRSVSVMNRSAAMADGLSTAGILQTAGAGNRSSRNGPMGMRCAYTRGHAAGDDAPRHVAGLFKRAVRRGDLLARIGGEEFAVLLPSTDEWGAIMVAERARMLVAASPVDTRAGNCT